MIIFSLKLGKVPFLRGREHLFCDEKNNPEGCHVAFALIEKDSLLTVPIPLCRLFVYVGREFNQVVVRVTYVDGTDGAKSAGSCHGTFFDGYSKGGEML